MIERRLDPLLVADEDEAEAVVLVARHRGAGEHHAHADVTAHRIDCDSRCQCHLMPSGLFITRRPTPLRGRYNGRRRCKGCAGASARRSSGIPERLRPSGCRGCDACRSEEHTSELQSLMRISYAVFCLKKNKLQVA